MLRIDGQIKISLYRNLYDIVVDKNNKLRKIKETIDFSFVNKMLEGSYCKYHGRPAKEPEMMFKLMFLKTMYNLSDEEVIENSKCNMAYKYFLDLAPEDDVVSPSLLTVFRKTRINKENLLDEMLKEIVEQAIKKGLISEKTLIVDATHTSSKYKNGYPADNLRKLSKNLRRKYIKQTTKFQENFHRCQISMCR